MLLFRNNLGGEYGDDILLLFLIFVTFEQLFLSSLESQSWLTHLQIQFGSIATNLYLSISCLLLSFSIDSFNQWSMLWYSSFYVWKFFVCEVSVGLEQKRIFSNFENLLAICSMCIFFQPMTFISRVMVAHIIVLATTFFHPHKNSRCRLVHCSFDCWS